jgi:hypothetical protein
MFCAFMPVHKFYLIVWLELDSNLFEFNRFEFEFEKEKGKGNREAVQPATQSAYGPPFPLARPTSPPTLGPAPSPRLPQQPARPAPFLLLSLSR